MNDLNGGINGDEIKSIKKFEKVNKEEIEETEKLRKYTGIFLRCAREVESARRLLIKKKEKESILESGEIIRNPNRKRECFL